jgi:hypothetical protein
MSAEIKTEKPTWTYPSARKTPTAFDVPASLEWIFDVPAGKMLAGFTVDLKIATVGAGMTTARVSQLFQKFRAFADGKLALDIDQYTMDLVPIFTQWAKHQEDYAEDSSGTQGATESLVVEDDINLAGGAQLYGFWKIHAPLPVKNQIRFQVDTYAANSVFGAGMTGGIPQLSIVPVFANIGKRKQYNIYAKQLASVLRASYRGVEVGGFFVDSEWTTVQNGVRLGSELTIEQMYAIQNNVGNNMLQYANAAGANVDDRLPTFQDPLTAADAYVLANKFDGQAPVDLAFQGSQDVKAIVLSEAGPDAIEVH